MRYPPRVYLPTISASQDEPGGFETYKFDTSGGAVTFTLKAANSRRRLKFVMTGSGTNALTIARGASDTIDGATSATLVGQYNTLLMESDGVASWHSNSGNKAYGVTDGTATASKAVVLGTNKDIDIINFGAIGSNDASLGVDGLAAAQGGAIVVTGGASSTATNAGGDVTFKGGAGSTSGAGGAANLTGGVPGVTGIGGAAVVTAGAGGATSGKGGAASVTGGAGTAGNSNGGAAILGGGAKNGSGFVGPVILGNAQLTPIWYPQAAPAADGGDTPTTITVAQMVAGLVSMTPTTGRAVTTPTGTELDAGVAFADVPATFGFDFTVQNRAAFAATDDILTLTAGASGVTVTGSAVVSPGSAARFRAVRTTTATWIIYKIAG